MSNVTLKWRGADGRTRLCDVQLVDDSVEVGSITIQEDSTGLGDTVKKVIDKVSRGKVKQCGGCKKRQNVLNKLVPYGDKDNGN